MKVLGSQSSADLTGAHLLLLARGKEGLEKAQKEMLAVRQAPTQAIDIQCVDLTKPEACETAVGTYGIIPDHLFCVAGGTSPEQIGFLADMKPEGLISCMEINYYTAIFIAQVVLKLWVSNAQTSHSRHITFVSSNAAFVSIPGYIAYTPTKVAIRAFADTLRQELLLYGGKDAYQVHCAYPGCFISESFLAEAANKPELTKMIEGSNMPEDQLVSKTESAQSVARKILKGLQRGNFFVTVDLEGALLLNNMRGPSPRDHVFMDLLLLFLALIVWPFVRRNFDGKTAKYGKARR
ncbi:NAD(P)-binding protein [Stipitochalara longipes BDJ]|nr:NAD(P)-binding protein [Stipitochalara longipes BDJ]